MVKKVFFIRHGYALHNKLYWEIGPKVYSEYTDTPLLHEGYLQAEECGKKHRDILNNIDLVLVSPLSRTLQTAVSIFGESIFYKSKIRALDCLMEYPQGGSELCNKRKNREILERNYPTVEFTHIAHDKVIWNDEAETIQDLKDRIEKMVEFIKNRPETNIAVVSHSSFLSQHLYGEIPDEKNELIHCKPYGPCEYAK
tara:strand:+ start:843 stop:1436 length:594 start_codon:yes stop_codon:yes gene_type:complete